MYSIDQTSSLYVVNIYSITSFQNVSIQVQLVGYQSQTGHDPQGYNPTIIATMNGLDLCSYQTKLLIQALNATQGHKPSNQTSLILIPNDVDDPTL